MCGKVPNSPLHTASPLPPTLPNSPLTPSVNCLPSPPLPVPRVEVDQAVSTQDRPILQAKRPIQRKTAPVDSPKLFFPSLSVPTKQIPGLFGSKYLVQPNPVKLTSGTLLVATQKLAPITRLVVKIDQSAGPNEQILADLSLLARLDHPNILAVDAVFYEDRATLVISDLFNGLLLVDYAEIAAMQNEGVVRGLAVQMLRGVAYLHAQNQVLKSISMPNMVFFRGNSGGLMVKLVTLGKREKRSVSDFSPIASAWMYTAPEALSGQFTEKADIWSLGAVLFFLLTNTPPFQGSTPNALKDSVLSGAHFSRKLWSQFDPRAKSLLRVMLAKDPQERPSAADCLMHPWLQETRLPPPNFPAVMANLRKFHLNNPLQYAILRFIVKHAFGAEEKQPLQAVFGYINTSGSGVLSLQELAVAFAQVNRPEFAQSLATDVLAGASDGTGPMEFTEFLLAASDYQGITQSKRLKIAFDLLDSDSSGSITVEEFKAAVEHKGKKVMGGGL